MAHHRQRQCSEAFKNALSYSSIVGLFGHRQVGKTTYLETVTDRYYALDRRTIREEIAQDPDAFLEKSIQTKSQDKKKPIAIDECQLEPDLFPALKDAVRIHKQPGLFVLSGSVRFSSRKVIRESLTGRMVSISLFPMVLSEFDQRPLPDVLPHLVKMTQFNDSALPLVTWKKGESKRLKSLEQYLTHGGLPKLAFTREKKHRIDQLTEILDLILDRDLRMVVDTRLSLDTLYQFLVMIAQSEWTPWNSSEVKRKLGLAHQTQAQLIYALEAIHLIRRIPLEGRRGALLVLEDQLEEYHLSGGLYPHHLQLLSAFYRNARAQFEYRPGVAARFLSYWSTGGAIVPLVIETNEGVLGVQIIEEENPTLSQKRSSDSFLQRYPKGKMLYLCGHPCTARVLNSRSMQTSVVSVL